MESGNLLPILALLALAVVVVLVLFRVMRARRATHEVPPAKAPPTELTQEDQEYLDSSHILHGGSTAASEAAARAAAALSKATKKHK